MLEDLDALVIGGGQAGLAAGYHLKRAGLSFAILKASDEPGGSWPGYYDSLRLFSPAHYSGLPGRPFPGDSDRYPARDEVAAYLRGYAEAFGLTVLTGERVVRTERASPVSGGPGPRRDADDVLQEVFLKAHVSMGEGPAPPQAVTLPHRPECIGRPPGPPRRLGIPGRRGLGLTGRQDVGEASYARPRSEEGAA